MDWIQGDKFRQLADFSYSPRNKLRDDYDNLANTFNLSLLKDCNLIYTHTMYVEMLFNIIKYLGKKFVVMTHSCDISIEEYGIKKPNGRGDLRYKSEFILPDNVVKWYSKNINVIDPRIESIPIGIENDWWHKKERRKEKMINQLKRPRKIRNLVYMNHDIKTNPNKRKELYQMFGNKSWVTAEQKNRFKFDNYINNIYNHKFVFCTEGNGMDTHRTWEVLYMGTIPIEKRNINNQFYTDLPICFVDNWGEVTEDFLNSEYARIKNIKWNLAKLDFGYWREKIFK